MCPASFCTRTDFHINTEITWWPKHPMEFSLCRVLRGKCEIKVKHNTLSLHQTNRRQHHAKTVEVQRVETMERSCLLLKWLPRLANWLNLSTMKEFSFHNYSRVFSARRQNGICDWMRLFRLKLRSCDFVTLIAGSFGRVRILPTQISRRQTKGGQSSRRAPSLATHFAHPSPGWLMKRGTHLSLLMSLCLRPDFNADLVETTSPWKREKRNGRGRGSLQRNLEMSVPVKCEWVCACVNGVMLDY